MEIGLLKELGLTENEIKIYTFLLKNGPITTGPIIKETKIVNSRVYESLNSLISKGFVIYNIQKDGKHFEALDPKNLLKKQKELEERIKKLVPQLQNIKGKKQDETTMAIYEGFQGFKTAFRKIIEDCPKRETIYVTGFPERVYKMEQLRLFLINMNLKSSKKKQKLKLLLEQSTKKNLGKDREKEPFTEVRYMPKGYISPIAIDVFLDYVYIFLWEEKPYVFMIKNKKISESFKMYHKFLWKMAKL